MATIIDPAATRALAIRLGQPLRLQASATTNWYLQTNGGGYTTQIGTGVDSITWTPSSIARRFTFDDVQIGVGSGTVPTPTIDDSIDLNVCEGPPVVLQVTPSLGNDILAEPSVRPDESGRDDPPLGVPLFMPGANRNGLGTELQETADHAGGPANLTSYYGPGVFVDTAGNLGIRTPIANVRGLGPYPAIANFWHTSLYFTYDFGRSRSIGLTRRLYVDASNNVAVIRGDGRRSTYRSLGGGAFAAAASLQNTLALSGGVYTETSPNGTLHLYDSTGVLQKVVDRYGSPVYYTYDVNSRLQQVQGPAGSAGLVPYLAYDGSGLCSILCLRDGTTPANNRTTYFTYDGNKNLTKIIGPELCITYFEYNSPSALSAVTDPEGFRWYFAYDANGRTERVIDALGNAAYFAYDASSAPLTTQRDRTGKATYFQYNAFGSPTRVYNLATPADYYGYDGEGNLLRAKNRLGNEWVSEYDGAANRISVTDPLSARSYFAYDATLDLLKFAIDPLGRFNYFAYDGSRNRTSASDPYGNTTYYDYTATGLMRYRKDRRGAFNYFGFDSAANMTAAVDALNNATYFAYNSAGDRTALVDPLLRISYWGYDLKGRVTSTKDPLGAARSYAYDDRCNLLQEVDPRGFATYYVYDGDSNRTKTIDALGSTTYLRYDAEERVLGQRNALFNETTWTYDALGRRQKQIDALGGERYFAYDDAHETYFTTDELGNPSYLRYDLSGRVQFQIDAYLNQTYFG